MRAQRSWHSKVDNKEEYKPTETSRHCSTDGKANVQATPHQSQRFFFPPPRSLIIPHSQSRQATHPTRDLSPAVGSPWGSLAFSYHRRLPPRVLRVLSYDLGFPPPSPIVLGLGGFSSTVSVSRSFGFPPQLNSLV